MYYVLSSMYQGRKNQLFRTTILVLFLTAYYLVLVTSPAGAATRINDTFILQTNDINIQTKDTTNTPTPTPEALPKPFIFTISDTILDFGQITPTDPILRTTTTSVSPGNTTGFSLFGLEDHELQSLTGKIIPDTTCDNGNCQSGQASAWENTLTYGFGWQCKSSGGFDCSNFATKTTFAPFPNQIKRDVLSPLLSSFTSQETEATLIYKTNISPSQDIGLYTNELQLIAVPNF